MKKKKLALLLSLLSRVKATNGWSKYPFCVYLANIDIFFVCPLLPVSLYGTVYLAMQNYETRAHQAGKAANAQELAKYQ
jgi:hypothetical protein